MKKNKRVQVRQAGDHTIVVITLLFLVALAVAPLLWGLYFERELLLIGTAVLACCLTLFVQLIRKNALRFDYLDGLFLFLCLCFFISLGNAASLREAYPVPSSSLSIFPVIISSVPVFSNRRRRRVF